MSAAQQPSTKPASIDAQPSDVAQAVSEAPEVGPETQLHPPDVVGVVLARLRASRGGAEERSKRMRWRHDEILGKLSRDAKVAAMSAVVDKRFALGPAR